MSSSVVHRWVRHPAAQVAGLVWLVWGLAVWGKDVVALFSESYFMSITMVAGSFIAGATSEGGGAVAFPVMTLLFDIEPRVARDFSLMIQSVGMTAAGFVIWRCKIPVEWRAVRYASLGGAVGIILGIEVISPMLPPAFTKMFFCSFWLSFCVALFLINRNAERQVYDEIPQPTRSNDFALGLLGVAGGIISGLTGSGLDILVFSALVLGFRLSERVATPTSVVLMGLNAAVGFGWRLFGASELIAQEAWNYWWVCIPVVVVGAPAGARFIANRSRYFIAGILYASISVQFAAALLIIPQSSVLLLFSGCTFLLGGSAFLGLGSWGKRRSAPG